MQEVCARDEIAQNRETPAHRNAHDNNRHRVGKRSKKKDDVWQLRARVGVV